jgi:adenosylmethionine-8-amino-7-oxononanoate aminotransferase
LADETVYKNVMPKLRDNGLLVGPAEHNKIVLRPPYVITKEQIDSIISIFEKVL